MFGSIISHVFRWMIGGFLLYRIPFPIVSTKPLKSDPSLSIIIPARNEALNLPHLLSSLKRQIRHEIIVVDDDSDDDTARVAQSFGARVVSAGPLPSDMSGKAWACWQGAQASHGDILVFLDADTRLSRNGLAKLRDTYQTRGGLLTVQPYHLMRKPHEQFSLFFYLVMFAAMGAFTPLGHRLRPRGAFGACVVCSRDLYFENDGHRAAGGRVLEDMAMARHFQKRGIPLWCLRGKETVSVRMYSDNLRQLVAGFSKGFASGAQEVGLISLLAVIVWISGLFAITVNLVRAFIVPTMNVWIPMGLYVLYAAQIRWMAYRVGNYRHSTAALFPVPLLVFTYTMVYSLIQTRFIGRVSWKGRHLNTR